MGTKKELTEKEKTTQIEKMLRYDKANRTESVTGQIIRVIALNGVVSIKAILLIRDYADSTIERRIYKLQQLGLIKKKDGMCQLKNLKKTYQYIKCYVPDIPREVIEENLRKAKSTQHKIARERLGKSSEVTTHILNMDIPIVYNLNELENEGYIISSYYKREIDNKDIARSRIIGTLINKKQNTSYSFYYVNETNLNVIHKETEKNYKKYLPTKINRDVIILNKPECVSNMFSRERGQMLEKMDAGVLVYPNIKSAYELMELTLQPQFSETVGKLFPRNHNRKYEADIIDEEADLYVLHFLYPDIQRLKRFYLMMNNEIHHYKIVTFKEYDSMIEGMEEELGITIERELHTVDDIIGRILG